MEATPDLMLSEDLQNIDDQFRYVLDMGLNTVRLEGKLETEEFFDMADRYGVLMMAGWCCCDHWEHWPKWKPQDFDVAKASLTDQMYRLREPSEPDHVAERQRQSSAAGRGRNVSRDRESS